MKDTRFQLRIIIEPVKKNIFSFKPDLVVLDRYSKHGFVVWDVLREIKIQDPDLPVLMVTAYDNYLFDSHISPTDGYVIKSHFVCDELKQKIPTLINRKPVANDTEK